MFFFGCKKLICFTPCLPINEGIRVRPMKQLEGKNENYNTIFFSVSGNFCALHDEALHDNFKEFIRIAQWTGKWQK